MNNKKIRVLVIDDSPVFRKVIEKGLSLDEKIEVVGTAIDAFDARNKIIEFDPDVITCDIEMPKMDGITFVKQLMPQYPKPVIMVSSLSDSVFDAMKAGAVDFISKPNLSVSDGIEDFVYELIRKIRAAAGSRVIVPSALDINRLQTNATSNENINNHTNSKTVIAVGASTGGTVALTKFISQLPIDIPGMVIVQHIPPKFSYMFAERLNSSSEVNVKEAETGDYIERGCVLIAPGNKHMRIVKVGHKYKVECFQGEKVSGHCPSVDVLFESVAKNVGKDAVGIILTGMGSDGAKGLLNMKRKGAMTIGQDAETSVVYGMPKAAFEIGAVEKQLPLLKIAPYLLSKIR